jgi:hypothetical protein
VPWRGPEVAGEFPTLGYLVADLIQEVCAIPDGPRMGQEFLLTDEQINVLLHHYRLDPETGKFVHFRGTQLVRSQKWGKGPFAAAVICAEAHPEGPVLFDGWGSDGEPRGRPWPTPHVQVTAVSEDQTDNVFRALLPMIQLGALAADIPDTGLTRINLPSGGLIEPVTAAARSRLGQRVTFVVQDQTESWLKSNGGHALADNQRRGLAGMGGRFLSTPNAWDPIEESVAQRTGESKTAGVHHDDADPGPGSIRNKADRRRMLRKVYGDAATKPRADAPWEPWIDLDRIDGEIEALLEHDPAQAERWFLNRKLATEGAAFDLERFKSLKRPGFLPPRGSIIVIGVDGARHHDALALVATDVKTGFQWPLEIIERPEDAGDEYEHDQDRADGAMVEAMERYVVWRVYIDPQYIDHLVEKWSNRYGPKRVVEWLTYRPRNIAWAVREYAQAIGAGDVSHDGNEAFVRHVGNARKRALTVKDDKEQLMHTLSKDSVRSLNKIDAAMAGVLSWKARSDAVELGIVRLDGDPAPEPEPDVPRGGWRPGEDVPDPSLWRQPEADALPMGFMM